MVLDQPCRSVGDPGVRCPFYGFEWPAASHRLVQVAGNQCGLALDRVESCAMEEECRAVDMENCPTAQRLEHFILAASSVMVFVTANHPEGLPYAVWLLHVMLRACDGSAPRFKKPLR